MNWTSITITFLCFCIFTLCGFNIYNIYQYETYDNPNLKEVTEYDVIRIFKNHELIVDNLLETELTEKQRKYYNEDLRYILYSTQEVTTEGRMEVNELLKNWTPKLEKVNDLTRLEILKKSVATVESDKKNKPFTLEELRVILRYLENSEK